MYRKRLLARGLLVGYLAVAAQIFYSLASIPLALSYLGKAEFGMFSLISTLMTYLELSQLGMTDGFNRHLFECKDGTDPKRYGRYFTAGMLAMGGVSLFVLILGIAAIYPTASLFNIPSDLEIKYRWVMIGMVCVTACHIGCRMFFAPLYVHQRHDLIQLNQLCQYGVFYVVLHYGLQAGWGVYSLLANQAAALIFGGIFCIVASFRLGIYPKWGDLALPHREEWRSVLRYSKEIFEFNAGRKLASGMPMLLLPRLAGLEAVAAWTVCSRSYNILNQLVAKPFEYCIPFLYEAHAAKEYGKISSRWSQVNRLVLTTAVCVFAVAAANNEKFVQLWTSNRIQWEAVNHWLLAMFFVATIAGNNALGVIGISMKIGRIRYAPYLQALFFLINAIWMTKLWGVAGMLLTGVVTAFFCNISIGVRYLAFVTKQPTLELAKQSLLRPALVLPLACACAWACSGLQQLAPGYVGLLLSASAGSLLTGLIGYYIGFDAKLRHEFLQLLAKPLAKFGFKKS